MAKGKKSLLKERMTNAKFAESNGEFLTACRLVKLPHKEFPLIPSRRQASKFRRGLGVAFKTFQSHKAEEQRGRRRLNK